MDLCADDEDPSRLIIRPGWDAPHVRCYPRTFCAWPCLLRQVGTILGSPYDYVVAGLAYANPGSRHVRCELQGLWRSGLSGAYPAKWKPCVHATSIMDSWYTPAGFNLLENPCSRLCTTSDLRPVHRQVQLRLS